MSREKWKGIYRDEIGKKHTRKVEAETVGTLLWHTMLTLNLNLR